MSGSASAWALRMAGRRVGVWIGVLCVAQALSAVLAVCLAPVMMRALDAAVAGDAAGFWGFSLALALLVGVQVALRAGLRYLAEATRSQLENRLRLRALAAMFEMSARSAESWHSAELMTRMTSDVQVVGEGLCVLMPSVVSMTTRLVGILAVMTWVAPGLLAVFLLVAGAGILASAVLRRELGRRHRRVQDAEGVVRRLVQECLESLLVVRSYGAGAKVLTQAERAMGEHRTARLSKVAAANFANTGFSLVTQGSYVAALLWCGSQILAGTLTYGALVAVIQLVGQAQAPIQGLGGTSVRWASLEGSADRLREVCGDAPVSPALGNELASFDDEKPAGPAGSPAPAAAPEAGPADKRQAPCAPKEVVKFYEQLTDLRFIDVSFGYETERTVLRQMSAWIPKGSLTAVVGPSGAGKSTLMKLLLAAYEPAHGSVVLEGQGPEGSRWSAPSSAAPLGLFAYVPQGNRLMAGTVLDVVSLAEKGAEPSVSRAEKACEVACAAEFVAGLPQGLQTPLGERGAGVSEGQAQRLAVARAVYSGAPILLLDEATSALDARTERQMLANLRELEDRTIVIITHRPEVVELCDHVVRLNA